MEEYIDSNPNDDVEDDLYEVSSLVFSEQQDPVSGLGYAYVVSDKEQKSLKVVRLSDNIFGEHYDGIGEVVARYRLNVTADNDDWEDISLGPCTDSDEDSAYSVDQTCIYIGNFGNNARDGYDQRDVLTVFKFVEPVINTANPQNVSGINPAIIQYRYGGGFDYEINDGMCSLVCRCFTQDALSDNAVSFFVVVAISSGDNVCRLDWSPRLDSRKQG